MDTLRHSPPMQEIRSLYCLQQYYSVFLLKRNECFQWETSLKFLSTLLYLFSIILKRKERSLAEFL